jgi:4-hydroxy-4-methyl-2-oxoglutarate aldolase
MSTMKEGKAVLTNEELEPFRHMSTSLLANAIETFQTRLRNEGFADSSVRCLFPRLHPMVGYAVTVKVRGSNPPTAGGLFPDRSDWWDYIQSLPEPRVVAVQDCATRPGLGSLLGTVQLNILHAFGCVGAVTNGAVCDIPAVEALRFPVFAGAISVSHAYVHIVEIGGPVEIGGLKIKPGDLLHGDMHGVQSIPLEIAAQIPDVALEIANEEEMLVSLCESGDFSLEKLQAAVARTKY